MRYFEWCALSLSPSLFTAHKLRTNTFSMYILAKSMIKPDVFVSRALAKLTLVLLYVWCNDFHGKVARKTRDFRQLQWMGAWNKSVRLDIILFYWQNFIYGLMFVIIITIWIISSMCCVGCGWILFATKVADEESDKRGRKIVTEEIKSEKEAIKISSRTKHSTDWKLMVSIRNTVHIWEVDWLKCNFFFSSVPFVSCVQFVDFALLGAAFIHQNLHGKYTVAEAANIIRSTKNGVCGSRPWNECHFPGYRHCAEWR